jgi:hypothetical protein
VVAVPSDSSSRLLRQSEDNNTGATGTIGDARRVAPYDAFFEQWGRKIDWVFIT